MKTETTDKRFALARRICSSVACLALGGCLLFSAFGARLSVEPAGVRTIFVGKPAIAGQPIPAGDGEGFNRDAAHVGASIKYTITLPTIGAYVFSARVSSPAYGAKFHTEFDGTNLTGSLAVPNSGGWTNWNTVASRSFRLTAGPHLMRVVFDSNMKGLGAAGSFDVFNVTPIIWPKPIHWTAAAPSPVKRFEGYARSRNGKLFTFGGYNSLIHPYAINTDGSIYDPATNNWASLGQMPVAPTHAGLAQDPEKGILYFVGGLQGAFPGVATTEVWSYDMNDNAWTPMPSLPLPLAAGDAVLVNGQLHYFAGIGSANRSTNVPVHYVLQLGQTDWHTAAAFPTPRDHISAVALNGKIYVFGGEIGHDTYHMQQTEADVYDPATDKWSRLADMPLSKSHTESSTFVTNGKIIIAGGQIDNYESTNTILEYDPVGNTWALLGNLPGVLQGTMLQRIGNQLVLTNGYDGTYMKTGTWIANWPG